MDNLIDFIYDRYSQFIQQDLISKFTHTHTHLYYTSQSVISIWLINNAVSRRQLRAIQCVVQ